MRKLYLIFLLFLICSGCLNSYESQIIGNYKVANYKMSDSTKRGVASPTIKLLDNKEFILFYNKKVIKGEWSAEDAGDYTIVNLNVNNNSCQGLLSGGEYENIIIKEPFELGLNDFAYIEFHRY
jgi:hypothetical protein